MTVRARTERNFRRPRHEPARRRRLRVLVSWSLARRGLVFALLLFGVYQSVAFAVTTPLLRVEQIAVHGNVRLSSGQVQALLEDLRGANILRADLDTMRQRLADSPWIAHVALRKVLPSTIEVFVSERQPMGLGRLGRELYLIDETGAVLDHFGPQYAEFDLPIVDGLLVASRGSSLTVDPRRAELASRVIAALARSPRGTVRLSQVDVSDVDDAVVLLEQDSALLHLGTGRFLERVQAYLDLSPALRERVPEIDYVDLRFDRRVYVRPLPAGGRLGGRQPARPAGGRQF